MEDMEDAKDKVLMGPERRSILISDKEKEITAYHEGGHAILGVLTGSDPVHKVTIIPRGRALGITMQLPKEDRRLYSKQHWLNQITVLFGGHLAEDIKFKEVTTGSSNDLERASDIARKMVCVWGMSEKMGPITFGKQNEQIFLGREISQHRDYSELTAQLIDAEVNGIVVECKNKAQRLLKKNMGKLDKIALSLIERETLTGAEINLIMSGQKLPPMLNHDEKVKPQTSGKNDQEAGTANDN
jgi:cell division protease FtsH